MAGRFHFSRRGLIMAQTESLHTGAEVYRRLKERGLELRRDGSGRDDALYQQLRLCVGAAEDDGVQKTLDRNGMSGQDFIVAFLSVVEPFAQMARELYELLAQHKQKVDADNLRVVWDLDGATLDFDLEAFLEFERRVRTVGKQYSLLRFDERNWPPINKPPLLSIWGESDASRPPDVRFSLPRLRINLHIPNELDGALRQLAKLTQNTIDSVERGARENPNRNTWSDDLNWMYVLLTDLVPGVSGLINGLNRRTLRQGQTEWPEDDALRQAGIELQEWLDQAVTGRTVTVDSLVEDLPQGLNLPMWEHRWQLYEVWCLTLIMRALAPVEPSLTSRGETLTLGRHGQCIALANTTTAGDLCVREQLPLTVETPAGRLSVRPDYVVTLGSMPSHLSAVAIVEAKQRKAADIGEMAKTAASYATAFAASQVVFVVNYDTWTEDVPMVPRALLVDMVRPGESGASLLTQYLRELICSRLGIPNSVEPEYTAVLVDVSGSMEMLEQPDTQAAVGSYVAGLAPPSLLVFSDRPASVGIHELDRHLQPHGGTEMEEALRHVAKTLRPPHRLLIVTDDDGVGSLRGCSFDGTITVWNLLQHPTVPTVRALQDCE
jgi:hypothetical protein